LSQRPGLRRLPALDAPSTAGERLRLHARPDAELVEAEDRLEVVALLRTRGGESPRRVATRAY
jgi:hypothetical protein